MTMQTLFRNVTLPLPLRLRALPEIDTCATLKTNCTFQIKNSLRRTIWFEFQDDEPDVPQILSEYFLKIMSDNLIVPRSRSHIRFKDLVVLVPDLNYISTGVVINIPLDQFLKETKFFSYLNDGAQNITESPAFGILNTRVRSNQFYQMPIVSILDFAQTTMLHTSILVVRNQTTTTRIEDSRVEGSVNDNQHLQISSFFQPQLQQVQRSCMFCYEVSTKVISSSCKNHFLCLDCMNTYMLQPSYNHPINGLSNKFECPFDGCFAKFDINAVSNFVDENVKEYLKRHIDSLPDKCGMPIFCQRCGSTTLFDLSENAHDFECSACLSNVCLRCAVPFVTHIPLKVKIQTQDVSISRGCLCHGIVDKISINGWTYGMKKTNGWFLANLSNDGKEIYTIQKRDMTTELVKKTIYSLLNRSSPFFTKCSHCNFQLERSEACTELKHCNIPICSLCGFKAAPGEKTIPNDHWKTCFRYEDELLECVGAKREDTLNLQYLRRALHVIRFFEQLSDHYRIEASLYLHELLESPEFVEDKFSNAKDFQYGLVAMFYGVNNIHNCCGEVQFSTLFAASLTELLKSPENMLPTNLNLTNGTHNIDDDDSSEESSEYTGERRSRSRSRPRSRSRSRSPHRTPAAPRVAQPPPRESRITNVSDGTVLRIPFSDWIRRREIQIVDTDPRNYTNHRNT